MRLPNWRRDSQLFTPLTSTDTTVGLYVGRSGDLCQVNVGDSTIEVRATTKYRPFPAEPVILTWTHGRLRLTGPARAKSSDGVVTAVSFPYVTVSCDGRSYRLPYAVTLEGNLAVNDAVAIDWDGSYVRDKLSAPSPVDPINPKLTTDQRPFTLTFFAKQSGSYKLSKWYTQDVRTDANEGGWFYGNIIHHTLRDDAYISSLEIYLPVRSTSGKPLPLIGRHSNATRPTGSLSVSDAATRKLRGGWVRLPTAWALDWRAGNGGVAVNGGGNTVYKGIQADRQSGKLRIRGAQ